LAANLRPAIGKLCIDQGAGHRDQSAEQPDPDDQLGRMTYRAYLGRIDENPGADDPAMTSIVASNGPRRRTRPWLSGIGALMRRR
jgi:hypothetical protein